MARTFSYARVSIPALGLKAVWGNYYVASNGLESNPGTATYKVAVEYPAGTIYPCTFGGNATASIAGLADAITDGCGPAIPKGAMFWTRVLYTNASGVLYTNYLAGHYSSTLDCFLYGTGTATDVVDSGTCSGGGGAFAYAPTALIGYTTQPSVCVVGDSRAAGYQDADGDATGDTGPEARAIGPTYAYTKLATPAITAQEESTNFTNRLRIVNYCTTVIDELGINDSAVASTPSTVAGYRTTIASLWTIPTIGETLAPVTTDSWAITSNASESGGTVVYTGTFTNCGSGACNGLSFTVAGEGNANCNGGPWAASSTTTTTLTLANSNASCTSATHAATATDNWSSTINQVVSTNVSGFNALVRAGISGEVNYWDVDYVIDPTQINKWPVAPNIFATTGTTANYGTTDGIHETNTLNNIIAKSGYVNVKAIQ
jgi:hypothetical protein